MISGSKVLVVDDEPFLADTLVLILNKAGFQATAAYSGIEAVEVAKSLEPDLIISDILMPYLSGIEAMIVIRDFLPACKILLFSGHASATNLLESARARGYYFEFLPKPIYPRNLLEMLRTA